MNARIAGLAVAALLTACGSVRTGPSTGQWDQYRVNGPVAIVARACVFQDKLSDDDVVLTDASLALAQDATSRLKALAQAGGSPAKAIALPVATQCNGNDGAPDRPVSPDAELNEAYTYLLNNISSGQHLRALLEFGSSSLCEETLSATPDLPACRRLFLGTVQMARLRDDLGS